MELTPVTEDEFDRLAPCRKLIVHDYARRFAVAHVGDPENIVGFSWESDLIEPQILTPPSTSVIWIGVDERLAALDLADGRPLLLLPLFYPFCFMEAWHEAVIVCTQLEVLVFNAGCTLCSTIGLPDIAMNMNVDGSILTVHLLDGSHVRSRLDTGQAIE